MAVFRLWLATLVICMLILPLSPAYSWWLDDGLPVCTAPNEQQYIEICTDGSGGTFIVWEDRRAGSNVYAQHIDSSGTLMWAADGILVCSLSGQAQPMIVSDGAGGAIIAWIDFRSGMYGHIYAQRFDASGAALWLTDGVPIFTLPDEALLPVMAPDGAGGAIISWADYRNSNYDIFAQRINSSGTVLWTAEGVRACLDSGNEYEQKIVPDGAGGVVIVWHGYSNIYAQRIDASGTVLWDPYGVTVTSAPSTQSNPELVEDGTGGVIVSWTDTRNENIDIFAQRINGSGIAQWTAGGVAICTEPQTQTWSTIISDGSGGAIISWNDYRSEIIGLTEIYAQKISSAGAVQWTANGILVCGASGGKIDISSVSDGSGGALIIWGDGRNTDIDIYAQRLDASGTLHWNTDGVALTHLPDDDLDLCITGDGTGGAIVAWENSNDFYPDIYAQRIYPYGSISTLPPIIQSVDDVPYDQGGNITLEWSASDLDTFPDTEITHYSVWRRREASSASIAFDNSARTAGVPIDFDGSASRPSQYAGYAWEWIVNIPSHHFETYAYNVPSLYDSSSSGIHMQYFMVSAQTIDLAVYYDSPVDSGYSVDNLSPAQPLGLEGEQSFDPSGLTLSWEENVEPDLLEYSIYRGLSEGFIPASGNLILSTSGTEYMDDEWTWETGFVYKVSAIDIHGNESGYALLLPGQVTGDDPPTPAHSDYLSQNWPNPFNPSTTIQFGLKTGSHVQLRIYDASGRLISELVNSTLPAGSYSELWNGTNSSGAYVASGIYFYRLDAGGFSMKKKLVLLR